MTDIDKRLAEWLKSNTYHHSDFQDIAELVKAKEASGFSISVCIPTLNEEGTIKEVASVLKHELIDRYPLVDEIAVIDSGSTDRTLELASCIGVETFLSSNILPGYGNKMGKGENLWKAIYQLKGDIICYVDADIKNIHPRFVSALVAPLILRPEVDYVKAFYERPLETFDEVTPSGGGRVTEILVRPLFSTFFPELTALMQPLSGEYAARRTVLEQLSFPIGYGVETSHVIDLYQMKGLDAFAQTDLDKRVHRNQSTVDLGKMSFGILQTFLNRIQANGMVSDLPALHGQFRQFPGEGNRCDLVRKEIVEEERPPMFSLPEYREKHG